MHLLKLFSFSALLLGTSMPSIADKGLTEGNGISPRQRLDLMTDAVRTTNYRGTFVYVHGDKIESMKIIHRSSAQGEQERLVSLNGEAQEIVRNNENVIYYIPSEKKALIDKSHSRNAFKPGLPKDLDQLSKYYEFLAIGSENVAGRPCAVIAMKPRDMMRYGYRLWVDSQTHLLLKADVVDINSHVLEQMMFTSVEYPLEIPTEDLLSPLRNAGYTITKNFERNDEKADLGVRVQGVAPNGFKLSGSRTQNEAASDEDSKHIIFTDGMASISIFVARLKPGMPPMQGGTRMGAINAHGKVIAGHQITVVGDVPAPTVKLVANSVVLKKR